MGYNSATKKMKRLVLLIALMCVSMFGFAQTQIAVLQHNDTITNTFYGTAAFVNAYNAAADGDIITLSGGNFNSCNIKKALTIRGAGARAGNGDNATFLISNVSFEQTTSTVYVEGVNFVDYCYLYNNSDVKFVKCIMKNFRVNNYTINCSLSNCLFEVFDMYPSQNSSVAVINCVLYSSLGIGNCRIINSYVSDAQSNYYSLNSTNTSFENCILAKNHGASNNNTVSNSNVFSHCVAINMPRLYENLAGGIGSNTHVSSMEEVFETFTGGGINYYEEYILNEDFATSFPGNDGTEVGIHGGIMPFSLDPSYMIVKRCNVAGKSTIDGKLSVDIEIETEE